ncbi:hypothetical protein [Streptomyces noursei]|uniref:hypothetical protein n=1 Tax=Streptomyces noursei TaxID=1971 RepID=UPI0037FF45E9
MDQLPTTEPAWEDLGTQRLMAIILAALGADDPAEAVDIGRLAWHLDKGPSHVRQLAARLFGQDLAMATDIDPASVDMDDPGIAAWVWLTKSWPQDGPWDGMPRGLAPGLPLPAVEVLTPHATQAALVALTRERGGHEKGTRVVVLAGRYEGEVATVMSSYAWAIDDARETFADGPPRSYEVMFRNPGGQGHKREEVLAVHLRPATPDETAVERALSMGIETVFGSPWEACERWATTLVWWHQQLKPERWLTDANPYGRGPVITGMLAAVLYSVVRTRGLDEPADGSRVHFAPLAPVADVIVCGWGGVAEALDGVPVDEVSPIADVSRALRRAVEVPGAEHQAVLGLAEEVARAHELAAAVPAGTMVADLTGGAPEPRLIDQLDAIADTIRRQRDLRPWPEEL